MEWYEKEKCVAAVFGGWAGLGWVKRLHTVQVIISRQGAKDAEKSFWNQRCFQILLKILPSATIIPVKTMKDSESPLSRLQDSLHEDSEDPAQRCRLGAELPYNRTRRKLKEA